MSFQQKLVAQFRSLNRWDQCVVVLFAGCLMLLLRALGGFGPVDRSCVLDQLGAAHFISLNGSIVGPVHQEPLFWKDEISKEHDDIPKTSQQTNFIKSDLLTSTEALDTRNDEPELSFFLKHFNDRYDSVPLDSMYDEQD
jgi:hypothetical protein